MQFCTKPLKYNLVSVSDDGLYGNSPAYNEWYTIIQTKFCSQTDVCLSSGAATILWIDHLAKALLSKILPSNCNILWHIGATCQKVKLQQQNYR